MLRIAFAILWSALISVVTVPAIAQTAPDRSATGGAQTLSDILARQEQLKIDDSFRRDNVGDPDLAKPTTEQLGTLGGASDPDIWRALRYDTANVRVSAGGDVAATLVQDGGMAWLAFRDGPLRTYGGWLLLGTLGALIVFYLLRGRIGVDGEITGRTVTRFKSIERFAHWMLAGSFILLGITGLFVLFGRVGILPLLGHEFNSVLLIGSKWVHNNVSWAFMLALGMILVMWAGHNIPNKTDLTWIKQFGGIIGSKHPPAKKFNAGQKVIFWSVILFGGSIAVSGVSLLFPYELPLMAKTFAFLNTTGLPEMVGLGVLPTDLAAQEEMQLTQAWHAIMAFVLMAIVIAHIYIGSVGMEGAYDAMGSGEVDEAWAHQHHSIWLEEEKAKSAAQQPAE
ncbi:formate dehydrogenase subunit gamma [Epibacterium sp. SM1979]|uniref:Formate dehydrogenase subunit gamma n=1 Tax=Tritonibacter litoralis TaxID=2662264 RepID=A0A843YKP1_9RHOB|nr:formate dehydrogenase subunit gamma [Tritonibacter litoralis]MQQ10235.1 formate dehydrogenase subunit gamma [Tritonibacter litoralis]